MAWVTNVEEAVDEEGADSVSCKEKGLWEGYPPETADERQGLWSL